MPARVAPSSYARIWTRRPRAFPSPAIQRSTASNPNARLVVDWTLVPLRVSCSQRQKELLTNHEVLWGISNRNDLTSTSSAPMPCFPRSTMQTRTSLLAKSTSLLGASVALLFASQSAAQVNFSANFNVSPVTGWSGNILRSTSLPCAVASMRRNLYQPTNPTGQLVSPNTGTAIGGVVTITYDYKVYNFTGGGATPPTWGNFQVQYAASASGPWTTIATISNETQTLNTCLNRSHTFTPPNGPLFVRWNATHSGDATDYYLAFDNVSLVEAPPAPCTTPAPGNTVGPADACPGGNFTLSLQNPTTGVTVSYQWYSSTTSATGPWTPVGTNSPTYVASQTAASWYYCDVTCSVGPVTTASNVLAVPMSVPTFPQDWETGVVTPNCWSTSALVGTGLPNLSTVSAYGIGTGSVRWNFFNIANLDQPTLTSPTFSPLVGTNVVNFDVAGAKYTGTEIDQIVLEESNDGGTTWATVVTMNNDVGGLLHTGGVTSSNFAPTAAQWASLSFPVSAGTNRIRFRGISNFGNNCFVDNVSFSAGLPAYHATLGTGCYNVFASALGENFATASDAKTALDGNSLLFVNLGTQYHAYWGAGGASAYLAPTSPTVHAVSDEGNATITPTFGATPSPSGPVTDWTIHANGSLTAGSVANPSGFLSSLSVLGSAANLGFYVFHDFNVDDGGQVVSEEIGNMLYITWDAVAGYQEPTDLSTFQYQIDMATGHVNLVFVSLPSVDLGNNFVGGTLAGVSATPPSTTLSLINPFVMAPDVSAMSLTALGAPINGGPAVTYTINNVPESFPGSGVYNSAVVFSLGAIPGGYDLGTAPNDYGAPGCNGYVASIDLFIILSGSPTPSVSFPLAWNIPVPPFQLWMQAVGLFAPGSLPGGLNAGGVASSNALEVYVETF